MPYEEERGAFIEDIKSRDDQSFEEISDRLKTFAKSMKENENFSLKCKTLMGGWLLTAARIFRRDKNMLGKSLPGKFEDWIYKECSMRKQTTYNYKNLYKLMRLAPKLLNCRVNMIFFVKNHEILFSYFEESQEQTPWRHNVRCECEACKSYFAHE